VLDVNSLFHCKSILFASAAAVLVTIGPTAQAQVANQAGGAIVPSQARNAAGANAPKFGVAVVDISYIFKKHERFKAAQESMKKEMENIETELKADREKIAQSEAQRNSFTVGSAEYKRADEEVARMMAEFNLKMGRLRKDFLEREAKVYYQTYVEVVEAVNYYAQRQNIGLVLRFNGEPVDPNQREGVLREINKTVVVQNQIDITPDVLALLNRDQQQRTTQPGGSQPGVTQRPGQPGSQIPR
jgi:Skp family chaperone for outer membrane proteins